MGWDRHRPERLPDRGQRPIGIELALPAQLRRTVGGQLQEPELAVEGPFTPERQVEQLPSWVTIWLIAMVGATDRGDALAALGMIVIGVVIAWHQYSRVRA